MDRIPRPGEFYRHFKNHLYQVIAVASHTETGEKLVVYQALYGEFGVYARPLSAFNSPVDKEKYPDAGQELRFEKVESVRAEDCVRPCETGGQDACHKDGDICGNDDAHGPNPLLMEFLDAEDLGQRIEILKTMKGKISQKELDSIYVVLDMSPLSGDEDGQLNQLVKILETRKRYDGSRLR